MKKANLSLVRGDTMMFELKLHVDQAPESINFSAASNNSGDYIFNKNLSDGIDLVSSDESTRIYQVVLNSDDTENAEVMNYIYDVRISLNGDVFTLLTGTLTILPERKAFN